MLTEGSERLSWPVMSVGWYCWLAQAGSTSRHGAGAASRGDRPRSAAGADNDSSPIAFVPMSVTLPTGDGVTRSGSATARG